MVMEYEIEKTEVFDMWLKQLRDRKAVLAITARLDRARLGNFGDVQAVGAGISEMRIFLGPGYRIYYTIRNTRIIFMLCGGDKSSQQKDIKKGHPSFSSSQIYHYCAQFCKLYYDH
jgi:putative addiction module killer protein